MRGLTSSRLIDLGLLVAAAALASVSVSLAIEPVLLPLPQDPIPLRDKPAAQLDSARLDDARLAQLIDLRDPATRSLTSPAYALPLRVLGTLRANDASTSSALLLDTTDSTFVRAKIGDVLHGATLIRIDHGKVTFITGGDEQTLAVLTPPTPIPFAATPIRTDPNGRVTIPRSAIQLASMNLPTLATQARFIPAFPRDAPAGFRIDHIQPQSIYAQLGLKDGDVITRINGSDLSNLPALFSRAQELFTVREVTVELIHDGQLTRRVISIDG
ncbi:MAG: PDZ domain-containing protein [Myxococcaceae bacterium]